MPAEIIDLDEAIRRFDRILFDTCILVSAWKAERGGSSHRSISTIVRPSRVASIIAVVEFLRGPKEMSKQEYRIRDEWLREQNIDRLSFDDGANRTLRSQLSASREPRGVGDAMMAAHAVAGGLPLLTENIKHFRDVDHLVIVRPG